MINNHVVSLDLAKQLVEAGIVVESEFVWFYDTDGKWKIILKDDLPSSEVEDDSFGVYPAPLSSELGELLPYSSAKIDGSYFESRKGMASWRVYWTDLHTGKWIADFEDQSEANARAKMLLYLKEKELL